jgi:phenylacetate-coenzyme A ligase PaaK-like adenylate-forming protein
MNGIRSSAILALLSRETFFQAARRGGMYRLTSTYSAILEYQVRAFNDVWRDAYSNVPFYDSWRRTHSLPERIETLDELSAWPILLKKDLQAAGETLLRKGVRPTAWLKTGGSTGEPLHLPTWPDTGIASSSQLLGRTPYGYSPGMRTFLLWGHHHLYGTGATRQLAILKRQCKDYVSNFSRCSAYDLSAPAMNQAFHRYVRFDPECVIGFSAALVAFCRANAFHGNSLPRPPRLVVSTAGPLSDLERKELTAFFGCSICLEYGSVECGIMAYSRPGTKSYRTFWDTHVLQGRADGTGHVRNIVSLLTPTYVPLIRYDIGDFLSVADASLPSHVDLVDVIGRPNDIVQLADGTSFFGALIGDCVKQVSAVTGCQLFVLDRAVIVHVTASRPLTNEELALIRLRLETVVPQLRANSVTIECVPRLRVSPGGKSRLVIYGSPA